MQYSYPCVLTPEANGGFSVSFPDVPEALTSAGDYAEALVMAEDALVAALGAYIQCREDIPSPSPVIDGQKRIAVRSIVAAKLALYSAMRAQCITKTELARRMGLSEGTIRKLLNLDHRSHIGQVERALRMVGRSLVITDEPALQLN